ncbi:hypothetical protein ACFLRO_01315 [Bacteroidota bacterium]
MHQSPPTTPLHWNGYARRDETESGPGLKVSSDSGKDKHVKLALDGLTTMERLIDEAMQIEQYVEVLRPRCRRAAMQKAWFLLVVYSIGSIGILVSVLWSGWTVMFARIAVAGVLAGLFFVPTQYFVFGTLREDARLLRNLEKKGLDNARKAAQVGRKLNQRLQRELRADR